MRSSILAAFSCLALRAGTPSDGSDVWTDPTQRAVSFVIQEGVSDALLEHWLKKAGALPTLSSKTPDGICWGLPLALFAFHSSQLAESGMFDRLPTSMWMWAVYNPATPRDRVEALAADPAPYQLALRDAHCGADPNQPGWSKMFSPERAELASRAEAVQAARKALGLRPWLPQYATDEGGHVAALAAAYECSRSEFLRLKGDPETRPQNEDEHRRLKAACYSRQASAWRAWKKAEAELLLP